jgi:DNA-binding LytR/AlgR family response regulator
MAKGRVLLVEDQILLHLLWEDICDEHDLSLVGPATTNSEAEAFVRDQGDNISCVFLDVGLREESSIGVANMLSSLKIPVVVCSGMDSESLPAVFQQWPILTKPYRICEVEQYLNTIL